MKKCILMGEDFVNRDKAYKHMDEVFNFPQSFGDNLDALWDVLSMEENLDVEIVDARLIPRNLGDYGLNILDVFGDLGKMNDNKIKIIW